MTTITVNVPSLGPVEVSYTERGAGRSVLLLHGGGGPLTVAAFADRLAAARDMHVVTPVHPGFGGTPRPATLTDPRGLAALYVALLDQLGLVDVTVVGNSLGGWIAAEMALLGSPRLAAVELIDAVGIDVPGHPVADFFALTFPEIAQRSYYEPAKFMINPDAMTDEQRAGLAGNRAALTAYAGTAMTDPTLRGRLASAALPARVIWGESDRIADPDYGRSLADAIPGADFVLLTATGHMPQVETPDRLIAPVADFAEKHARTRPAR